MSGVIWSSSCYPMEIGAQEMGIRKHWYSSYCCCCDKTLVFDLAAMELCQPNLLVCKQHKIADHSQFLQGTLTVGTHLTLTKVLWYRNDYHPYLGRKNRIEQSKKEIGVRLWRVLCAGLRSLKSIHSAVIKEFEQERNMRKIPFSKSFSSCSLSDGWARRKSE